jgi:hypothetical protein
VRAALLFWHPDQFQRTLAKLLTLAPTSTRGGDGGDDDHVHDVPDHDDHGAVGDDGLIRANSGATNSSKGSRTRPEGRRSGPPLEGESAPSRLEYRPPRVRAASNPGAGSGGGGGGVNAGGLDLELAQVMERAREVTRRLLREKKKAAL